MSSDNSRDLEPPVKKVKKCRICGYPKLKTFLSLGPLPTPNAYLSKKDLAKPEPKYPLDVGRCINCGLVQLTQIVRPDIMFRNYKYIPSASQTMVKHFDKLAENASSKFKLKKNDLVIDIGSNDGTLLESFKSRGSKVLGIDPASNLVKIANKRGIETLDEFFSAKLAKRIRKKYGGAKVVTATNVVAHVDNLLDFFKGVEILLEKEGIFIAEFPYFVDLLLHTEFDTIYQEHLSYFSVKPLVVLLEKFNLYFSDIQRIGVHGGSLRIFVKKGKRKSLPPSVTELLVLEEAKDVYKPKTYIEFRQRVEKKKKELVSIINKLKSKGYNIIGYGASARGNILLNHFGIDGEMLDYLVDSTSYKQGLYTPGHHIPIYPEKKILEDQPDYALLLAWNFKDEILLKQQKYRKNGGKFILIVPVVEIV
jgi:hypothetical protein